MSRPTELSGEVKEFLGVFSEYIQKNRAATVGEWLYICGAMAALVIATQDLKEEEVQDAAQYMAECMVGIHKHLPSNAESNVPQ